LGVELLPRGRPFRPTFPDPREVGMSVRFEGDSRLHAVVGNYFSLLAVHPMEGYPEWVFHWGLEGAGFFTMRAEGSRFPLETADGLLGMYWEMGWKEWQAQMRYTHISAHLADGSSATPISYSRETLSFRGSYTPNPFTRLYGGFSRIVNTNPVEIGRLALQLGGSYFLPWNLVLKMVPFIGVDLKWEQESPINPSFNALIGIALNNPPEAYRSFRLFYNYHTGVDPRGQFFTTPYTAHSVGFEMAI